MQEERVALGSQAQAAGGAGEQAYLQLAFQALQRRAGHRREISNWRAAADNEPLSLVWTNTWRSS